MAGGTLDERQRGPPPSPKSQHVVPETLRGYRSEQARADQFPGVLCFAACRLPQYDARQARGEFDREAWWNGGPRRDERLRYAILQSRRAGAGLSTRRDRAASPARGERWVRHRLTRVQWINDRVAEERDRL